MARSGGEAATPLRVLIADDSAPIAEMLGQLLSDPGRVEIVGTADTEASVIDSVRLLSPDVLVLDLQLRIGSGTDVLRALRADGALQRTRVLVTSNHVAPQLRAACLELGASGFYDKVKELQGLAEKVSQIAHDHG